MTRRLALVLVMLAAVAVAACDDTPATSPSGETTEFSRFEVYEGTLDPGAFGFYSFTLGTAGRVELTLTSLRDPDTGRLLDRTVTLGLGRPSGMDCAVTSDAAVTPGLGAQVSASIEAGVHCVRLSDPGLLGGPVTFAVRITLRTGTVVPTPAPGSLSFASQVLPGGFTSRAFVATQNGTVTATLESLAPDSAVVNLGVGIPSGTSCVVTRVLEGVGAGAVLSVDVARATYCVTIVDPGVLTGPAAFTVRIDHP